MNRYSKTVLATLILGIAAALLTLLSGYGYQWQWWGLGTAFRILIPAGAVAAVLALIGVIGYKLFKKSAATPGDRLLCAIAAFLSVAVLINFGYWYNELQQGYPPIHDITTDLKNPPEFVAIAPLRAEAPNKTEYGGPKVAEMQEAYYHNLGPLYLEIPPGEAFDRALQAAKDSPWNIVRADTQALRIEAYHKLPWFGFIDDVVVRVDTADSGSRIDMRSVSRLGRGDLGVNAERIHDYFDRIKRK